MKPGTAQSARPTAAAALAFLAGPLVALATGQPQADDPPRPDAAWIRLLPIAGIPGEDFHVTRFFDRDPAPGSARDFIGGARTYDGHRGTDFGLAGFPVMEDGVPVLAVREGTVAAVLDGQDDRQTANLRGRLGNNILIRHDSGRSSYYGHLKRGSSRVRVGQQVRAGQQIAEVGSSGDSSGPHLHFECIENRRKIDPFAPPGRTAESRWVRQPDYSRPMKAIDAGISLVTMDRLFQMPRTSFVRQGVERIEFWLITMNQRTGFTRHWELLRPDGSVYASRSEAVAETVALRESRWWLESPELRRGKWTLRVSYDRQVVAVLPFPVLGQAEPAPPDRAPLRPKARIFPRTPTPEGPVICQVQWAGPAADPDLDRPRYRYVWSVDGRVVRDAVTAVRADYLPIGLARPASTLRCQVTATDGTLSSQPSNVSARVH